MKSGIFAGIALLLVSGGLAGCGQEQPAAPAPTPAGDLTVTNGRLVLAPVKGNPVAVYFDITNHGARDWMIVNASMKGAKSTMLHTVGGPGTGGGMGQMIQIWVPKGETVHFEPGKLHVMVMDPPAGLAKGGTSEVSLRFPAGDTMSFPVSIRGAGDER